MNGDIGHRRVRGLNSILRPWHYPFYNYAINIIVCLALRLAGNVFVKIKTFLFVDLTVGRYNNLLGKNYTFFRIQIPTWPYDFFVILFLSSCYRYIDKSTATINLLIHFWSYFMEPSQGRAN